mmetsp:Transcript_33307/g.71144  ORF Transcript_33307/g.71144 Transcript_33307/m.71144 type:complete len:213 (-) Transcript_33307:494-1132(-)
MAHAPSRRMVAAPPTKRGAPHVGARPLPTYQSLHTPSPRCIASIDEVRASPDGRRAASSRSGSSVVHHVEVLTIDGHVGRTIDRHWEASVCGDALGGRSELGNLLHMQQRLLHARVLGEFRLREKLLEEVSAVGDPLLVRRRLNELHAPAAVIARHARLELEQMVEKEATELTELARRLEPTERGSRLGLVHMGQLRGKLVPIAFFRTEGTH